MMIPERSFSSEDYRYGFNGMERAPEISPGAFTTEFRELDTRLGGRWWSKDPIVKPWESPYAGFSNNPIFYIDPSGLNPGPGGQTNKNWCVDCGSSGGEGGGNSSGQWNGNDDSKRAQMPEVVVTFSRTDDMKQRYEDTKTDNPDTKENNPNNSNPGLANVLLQQTYEAFEFISSDAVTATLANADGNYMGPSPIGPIGLYGDALALTSKVVGKAGIIVLTKISSNAIKGAKYTKSTLQLGQQMHKSYKAGLHNPAKQMFKEYVLPSGKRIDFLDASNGIIYELKPFNPRAMKLGQSQLKMYMKELQSMPEFKGINWKTVLETY